MIDIEGFYQAPPTDESDCAYPGCALVRDGRYSLTHEPHPMNSAHDGVGQVGWHGNIFCHAYVSPLQETWLH